MADYVSTIKEFCIRLRPTKKILINNQLHKQAGLRVQFHNFMYSTENKEIMEELDKLLFGDGGEKWQKWFFKKPSDAVLRKISMEAEAAKKEREERIAKVLKPEEKKQYDNFQEAISRIKGNAPQHVVGPRDLPVSAEARGEV